MQINLGLKFLSSTFLLTILFLISCDRRKEKIAISDIKGTWYLNKWTTYHTLTFDDSTVRVDNNVDTMFTLSYAIKDNTIISVSRYGNKMMVNKILELTADSLILDGIHDVQEKRSYSRRKMAWCDSVYAVVDEMPKFGNSDDDFSTYMTKLNFGTCGLDEMKLLAWTIDAEGRMINIDAPSLEGKCKQDVIKQLKKFPPWKPGRLNGKPVCVKMNLRMCIKTG